MDKNERLMWNLESLSSGSDGTLYKEAFDRIDELESQIAAKGKQEWTHMESEDSEPDDSLLNELGRRRFLCQVVNMGTMITATRLEIVQYAKGEGFLVKNKGGLISGVTHWQPLPSPPGAKP